ncbi:hypothetical protein PHLGIDRAFT_127377 [Phlebiopsis gigantea 11061_1 CR5-6]|uniref:Aminoglycoside phosphotransferase domain-containing protein n=1 Tax=Phlebiopsis gigantea (strain 11061_1 CR5-6) TaxID=745531 RepID=A0A0C3NRR2_PHLG1|nr:hypothetical protein PHLGIDRAFT_127377 [Phlebiopsis gigantea 11061_1 CR5-6]
MMKNIGVPVFDQYGIQHVVPGCPRSYEDWTLGESTSREHERFVESLEEALCGVVYQTKLRGQNTHQTYEVMLEGGEVYVVQKSQNWGDAEKQTWARNRAACETTILEWLEQRAPIIPAPRVLYAIPDYSILTKAPGKTLLECFGGFDVHRKETTIISYAHIAVELFQLEVPQRIGTLARGSGKDALAVVPRLGAPPAHSADSVYDSLEAFVGYLFACARDVAFAMETAADAADLLAKLEQRAARVIAGLPARALRCALMKDGGPAESSVLVDERTGVVTSVVDWAAHSVVPRVLAAEHPSWLRYDGVHDPAFARGAKWWMASPAESARLCGLFEQVVRSKSEIFYEALVAGRELRAILEWLPQLVEGEHACQRLRKWMQATRIL